MKAEHADLLGGTQTSAPARKPGRPPRTPPPAAVTRAAPPATPPVLASTKPEVVEPFVPTPEQLDYGVKAAMDQFLATDTVGDGFTGFRGPVEQPADTFKSVPNADGSVSLELPPVSTEYAAAQARKPIIIGQTSRDYAYKRVLRAGKRL